MKVYNFTNTERDSSDAIFSIIAATPTIVLASPNGGESFSVGSTTPIAWTATHDTVAFIYYTTNNGTSWVNIAQNPTGITSPYSWTIPNTPATQCRVKVYNYSNTVRDSSDAIFTIFTATPPSDPTNLIISTNLVNGNVTLSWTASTGSPTGYRVYRYSTGYFSPPASGTLLTTVLAPTTTCVDSAAIPSGIYFYRVTSYNGTAESDR